MRGTALRRVREGLIDARTEIVVGRDCRGNSVLRHARCEAPLLVRTVAEPAPVLVLALVGGAAGPLGGDRLLLRLRVEDRAQVSISTIAAALAQPGPRGEPSTLDVDIDVGPSSCMEWRPQPTISVAGSDHRVRIDLRATSSSTVRMSEGVVLGRHGEPPGRFSLRERVEIDDVAVLDHETVLDAGALLGPGGHGPGRVLHNEIVIGDVLPEPAVIVTTTSLQSTVHLTPRCALTIARSRDMFPSDGAPTH